MAADDEGNDLGAVGIPLTGHIGIAPTTTPTPTSAEGASPTLTIPDLRKLGLLTTDGGPDWTTEPAGDATEFWQDGYKIQSGLANCEQKVILAQTDPLVRELTSGKVPDENGMIDVDAGGHSTVYRVFTEEVFKNGVIRRRWGANVTVKTAKLAKSERGTVLGTEVTLAYSVHPSTSNRHFREWLLQPVATIAPTVTNAAPSGAAVGDTVTVTGTGFIGTTAVKVGTPSATSFSVVSDTSLTFVMPAGTSGPAAIVVTNAAGSSAAYSYTRG